MKGFVLPYKNTFDVSDPTPHEASKNLAEEAQKRMTLSDLINRLISETGDSDTVVRFRIQNWVRDGLLPHPRIVPAYGKDNRGTRGEYGEAHWIGFHVVESLRRHGKPITIMLPDPDNLFQSVMIHHDLIHRWIRQNLGDESYHVGETRQLLQRFGPPPMESWNLSPAQPWRLRLTTEVLGHLLPMARGESPEALRRLMDPWRKVSSDPKINRQELLYDEAIRTVWSKVCAIETDQQIPTHHIEWMDDDALAIVDGSPVWRLSTSQWTTKPAPSGVYFI